MAKYQKYAEYKDSGVEWLGEIPSHWATCSLSKLFAIKAGGDVDLKNFSEDRSEEYPYPIYTNANNENSIYGYSKVANYQANSITVSGRGEVGFSVYRDHPFDAIIRLLVLTPQKECHPKFYAYYINEVINFRVESSAIGQLSTLQISPYKTVLPAIDEQKLIISFLDYETAKIDSLITKQEKLIELLKEKRQSVISHAVTKGLNPDVPMKDSGVEWLGKVPEHWQLVPLKYLCTFSGGGTPTKDNLSYWTDGNIPWVSPKDMKTFWISETQDYITEKAVKESSTNIVEQNSLLMVVRSGILQRTIPIAINTVPVTMNQDMKALKFGKRVLVEYIANLIHGNTAQLLLEWSKEGATVESIEHEYLANSLIPLPSLKEQEEITQVIAKKMKVYAELTEKAKLQITLLQERRTALISSAVTGKIDVRNWQYPKEATTELSQ